MFKVYLKNFVWKSKWVGRHFAYAMYKANTLSWLDNCTSGYKIGIKCGLLDSSLQKRILAFLSRPGLCHWILQRKLKFINHNSMRMGNSQVYGKPSEMYHIIHYLGLMLDDLEILVLNILCFHRWSLNYLNNK